MANTKITVFDPNTHGHLLPALVDLHVDCIEDDNSLMRFHPPFNEEKRGKMLRFWEARTASIADGLKIRFMTLDVSTEGVESLSGVVELGMPESDTGPFRGDVEMLMISPAHRRKGLAKLLMCEMEKVAFQRGRTLLQLSTTAGSPAADFLYPSLGYIKFGTMPNYGITPNTGVLADGEYFYKDLARQRKAEK